MPLARRHFLQTGGLAVGSLALGAALPAVPAAAAGGLDGGRGKVQVYGQPSPG
jgi:hypothetical protein